jgi:hypothetical protein
METQIRNGGLDPRVVAARRDLSNAYADFVRLPEKARRELEKVADFTYYPPIYGKQC